MIPAASTATTAAGTEMAVRLERLARSLSLTPGVLGACVLGAWWVGFEPIKSLGHGWATMKANTALGLLLIGWALAGKATRNVDSKVGQGARLCAAGAAALGMATLLEYAFSVDLAIDQLLFSDRTNSVGGHPPGRPSPNTGLGLFTGGLAALSLDLEGRRATIAAEVFGTLTALNGLIALLGYAYGVQGLYAVPSYSSMAVHTAAGLFAAGAGALLLGSRCPWFSELASPLSGGSMARRLLPLVLVLPLLAGLWGHTAANLSFALTALMALGMAVGAIFLVAVAQRLNSLDFQRLTSMDHMTEQARQAERESRRHQCVLDALPTPIAELDSTGRIVRANQRWQEHAQPSPGLANPVGQDYRQMWQAAAGEPRDTHFGEIRQGVTGVIDGRTAQLRREVPLRDGSQKACWLEVYVAPLRAPGMGGAVATHRDVTRQHRLQDELDALRRMEAITRRSAGVAHDVNNLLMTIQSTVELMLYDSSHSAQDTEDLTVVREAVSQAAALTSQLMCGGRGAQATARSADVCGAFKNAERTLLPALDPRYTLRCEAPADLWRAGIHPAQMYQVLLNLLSNALDAMPNGGTVAVTARNQPGSARSTASVHEEEAVHDVVVVEVRDTGAGMDAATCERVFEPFFTTKRSGRGTGLGLFSCLGLVSDVGGRITVESEPGKGSVFRLYLPRCHEVPSA